MVGVRRHRKTKDQDQRPKHGFSAESSDNARLIASHKSRVTIHLFRPAHATSKRLSGRRRMRRRHHGSSVAWSPMRIEHPAGPNASPALVEGPLRPDTGGARIPTARARSSVPRSLPACLSSGSAWFVQGGMIEQRGQRPEVRARGCRNSDGRWRKHRPRRPSPSAIGHRIM